MNLSLTQTLKDMLNIPSNNSTGASFTDSFSNEDRTPVLLPSASRATIGSNANNLSFGGQSTSQQLDLIELNIGSLSHGSRFRIPMEDAINGNVVESPDLCNEILNNCTFVVPKEDIKSPTLLELTCPPPGNGDVSQITNSNFCKISKLIDYTWEKVANVNSLAICRNKPLIAYVLDPTYCKGVNIRNKVANERRDYSSQVIRFVNYEKPSERALSRTSFTAPVADIAFAFKSIKEGNEDKLAAIDKNSVINVFEFKYVSEESNGEQKLVVEKLFEILPDEPNKSFEYLHLKWCPFVPLDDDYGKGVDSGMSLAVSLDTGIEQFSIDKIANLGMDKLQRSELRQLKDLYQHVSDAHEASIIAVHLSNDATVICTAAVDNTVKFFELSTRETRLLHNWSPTTEEGDQISCFYFLDDYNYLLENCRHHFWAYLFIGTKNGHISIWDLGNWSAIQKLAIDCGNCSDNCAFEYKVDLSSKVITAVCGDNAFVFLIDFLDLDVPIENKSPESISTYPRITKIGRFQIYNEVLFFLVKRQSDVDIDIFWNTRKSLERCTVNVIQMTESRRSISPKQPTIRNSSTKFEDDEVEIIDSSMKKLSPQVKDLITKKMASGSTPPSVTLAQMFSKTTPGVNSLSDGTPHIPSHSRRSSTPSQEVASLLEDKEEDTIIEDAEVMSNDMNASKSSASKPLDFSLNHLLPGLNLSNFQTEFKLPENLATIDQLKNVETSLLGVINVMKEEMSQELTKVCQEVLKAKTELKDASQVRNDQLNKIINGLIKKLMEQMNSTISKGLEEFMIQLRMELNDVSIQVNKLKDSLKMQCDIQKQQQSQFERVVQDLNKRIQESNSQNQQVLKQLQQQLTVTKQLMNEVSSLSRSSSSVSIRGTSMTPQPTSSDLVTASLRAQQEEIQKKRVEEERVKQMNAILKKMESKDESVLHDALVQALNMKEPALITRICQQFERNPDVLVKAASKDQTALLSLLQQLSLSDFRQEKWKGKFLALIAPALDMESQVVRRNLSSFLGKLVTKLEEALKQEYDGNLVLVNALFQSYMRQISSQFHSF